MDRERQQHEIYVQRCMQFEELRRRIVRDMEDGQANLDALMAQAEHHILEVLLEDLPDRRHGNDDGDVHVDDVIRLNAVLDNGQFQEHIDGYIDELFLADDETDRRQLEELRADIRRLEQQCAQDWEPIDLIDLDELSRFEDSGYEGSTSGLSDVISDYSSISGPLRYDELPHNEFQIGPEVAAWGAPPLPVSLGSSKEQDVANWLTKQQPSHGVKKKRPCDDDWEPDSVLSDDIRGPSKKRRHGVPVRRSRSVMEWNVSKRTEGAGPLRESYSDSCIC